jgi:hypothetical protein
LVSTDSPAIKRKTLQQKVTSKPNIPFYLESQKELEYQTYHPSGDAGHLESFDCGYITK